MWSEYDSVENGDSSVETERRQKSLMTRPSCLVIISILIMTKPLFQMPPIEIAYPDVVFVSLVSRLQKDCNQTGPRLERTRPAVWSFDF